MLFQQLNRNSAEKVYVIVKNIAGGTVSAFYPVFYDTADATDGKDGYAVSKARTGQFFMFAGIPQEDIVDDGVGLVQVYGKGSCYVLVTTSLATGDQLKPATSTVHLVNHIPVSATSLVTTEVTNPWNFVTAMSVMASGISTAVKEPVFIRAL
jgi:hypothetical protein